MKRHFLLVPAGLLAALGCSTQATYTVPAVTQSAPGAVATLGLMDILTILPPNLGATYPGCITPTVNGNTATLAFNACPSGSGGTQTGTLTVTAAPGNGGATTYTETFSGLTTTLSPTLTWTLTGVLVVTVNGDNYSVDAQPNFRLSVTDTMVPNNSRVWIFTCGLTGFGPASNLTVNGSFGFQVTGADNVEVQIDAGNNAAPLTWNGGRFPVSGTLQITDTLPGASAQSVEAVFSSTGVNIGGGNITLANS